MGPVVTRIGLMAVLIVGQLIGWSGRAHYLCFASDGTLRGIDGGPSACFYETNHFLHDASTSCRHENDEHGDHLLLAVDSLSAHDRDGSSVPPECPIDQSIVSLPVEGESHWFAPFGSIDLSFPPRYGLLLKRLSSRQC